MTISATFPAVSIGQSGQSRAFQRVRRHSLLVHVLRILLPVAGVLSVLVLLILTRLGLPINIDLSGAQLSVTPNAIIMDNPHLTGFDEDNRHYSVRADRAVQELNNPNRVQLENVAATVAMAAYGTATISAAAGDYDNNEGTLRLSGGISIDSSDGYVLRMEDAHIDFGLGTLSSDNPVTIGYQDSETRGNSLEVTESGAVIVLDGDVTTTIMPPKRDGTATGATQEAAGRATQGAAESAAGAAESAAEE
jgi:lipopolysaccharide export system protein LptC